MDAKKIVVQKGAVANLLIYHAHNYANVNALKGIQMLVNEVLLPGETLFDKIH